MVMMVQVQQSSLSLCRGSDSNSIVGGFHDDEDDDKDDDSSRAEWRLPMSPCCRDF